jgi:hypothetical protein
MSNLPSPWGMRSDIFFTVFLLVLVCTVPVLAQQPAAGPEPSVYLNFDEGTGNFAMDSSGHGNAGTLHNITRIDGGGCSRAISFSNPDSYVAVPFRVLNHPTQGITVSTWFYTDNFTPAALISGYRNGGYRLGFGDGNDLWWTLNLDDSGDISVPVQHENIALHQWHQVTGTYDGNSMKVYLDGILRNQVNATGQIHYENNNYIMLGADAGAADSPAGCPPFFIGGLDEVRIYPVALTYNQVMDDRLQCLEGERGPPRVIPPEITPGTCEPVSGSVRLPVNETAVHVLSFANKTINGSWQISLPPGSRLSIQAYDAYPKAYPDAWYLEIADGLGKPARTIAFPNRNNAPAEAVIPSGNATVTVRYFSGGERFPATVSLQLETSPAIHPRPPGPGNILENPIIVIYSASWATLVAIILVMMWVHRRKRALKTQTGETEPAPAEDKKL